MASGICRPPFESPQKQFGLSEFSVCRFKPLRVGPPLLRFRYPRKHQRNDAKTEVIVSCCWSRCYLKYLELPEGCRKLTSKLIANVCQESGGIRIRPIQTVQFANDHLNSGGWKKYLG